MVRMFWQQQSAIVVSLLLHVGVFALVGMNVFGDAGLLKPEPQEPIVFIDLMPSAPPAPNAELKLRLTAVWPDSRHCGRLQWWPSSWHAKRLRPCQLCLPRQQISFSPFVSDGPHSYRDDCLPDPPAFRNPFTWDGRSAQTRDDPPQPQKLDPKALEECMRQLPTDSIETEMAQDKRALERWGWK